jgi:hypothetical protein
MWLALPANEGVVAITTLSGSATKGSRTLPVVSSAGFAVGQDIIVQSVAYANVGQQFTVTGTGVGTITVDDPIEYAFGAADTVQTFNPIKDVTFYGNGMQWSGSGGTLAELDACVRVFVFNVYVPTSTVSGYTMSFDIASRDCGDRDVHVNGGGVTTYGLTIESGNRVFADHCSATNCASAGFWLPSSVDCDLTGCWAWNNASVGAILEPGSAADVNGCQRCTVRGCNLQENGASGTGLYLQGVIDCLVSDVVCDFNGATGVAIEPSAAAVPCVAQLVNILASDCQYGVYLDAGVHLIQGSNWVTDRCTVAGVNIVGGAHMQLAGYRATDCSLPTGNFVFQAGSGAGGADVTVTGARIRKTQNNTGNWFGCVFQPTRSITQSSSVK